LPVPPGKREGNGWIKVRKQGAKKNLVFITIPINEYLSSSHREPSIKAQEFREVNTI